MSISTRYRALLAATGLLLQPLIASVARSGSVRRRQRRLKPRRPSPTKPSPSPQPKRPPKSSYSKPKSASKPTATPAKKSTRASASTANSAPASSRTSTSISTAPTKKSKSRWFTSRTRAAARPTFFRAQSPTSPTPRRRLPRLSGRPRQIDSHPRPRARRHSGISRHHDDDASRSRARFLARPLFRSHRRRHERDLRSRSACAQRFARGIRIFGGCWPDSNLCGNARSLEDANRRTAMTLVSSIAGKSHPPTLPKSATNPASGDSDVVLTTFSSWDQFQQRLQSALLTRPSAELWSQAAAAMKNAPRDPSDAGNGLLQFRRHENSHRRSSARSRAFRQTPILRNSVVRDSASPEDKISLYTALTSRTKPVKTLLVSTADAPEKQLPRPSLFSQILVALDDGKRTIYLDPDLEVAPWGVIRPDLRGKKALDLGSNCAGESCWMKISGELPFSSTQRVNVDATIAPDGTLDAKVKYTMRGDNELLLRIAFHQSSARQVERSRAAHVALRRLPRKNSFAPSASDPYATKNAFTVEYEISQPKFVDWSKKPVRIPAPLPVLSVPDLPARWKAPTNLPRSISAPRSTSRPA